MIKLLFICTHNRCRSILAEAICNAVAGDSLIARSAGSQPAGQVHPDTLKYLAEFGIPTEGLSSQSWEEMEHYNPDVVITVCDQAASEVCPAWMGKQPRIHWGLPDPSRTAGDAAATREAFYSVMNTLRNRLEALQLLSPDPGNLPELLAALQDLSAQEAK